MVGFFDRFEQPEDPVDDVGAVEPNDEQPDWAGHPHAFVPGRSNKVVTLFRTDAAVLVLCCIDAYPSGLEFTLRLLLAKGERTFGTPPFQFWHVGEIDRSAAVRFGVEFADGRCWSSTEVRPSPGPMEQDDLVVMPRGGGGGTRFWEWDCWLWPLPPDGPLTIHVDWPARGVPENTTVIDATELRALARTAVPIGFPSAPEGV